MSAFQRVETTTITEVAAFATDWRLPGFFDAVYDFNPKLSWLTGTLGRHMAKVNQTVKGAEKSKKRMFPGGDITEHVEIDKGALGQPVSGLQSIPAVEEQISTLARWTPAYYAKSLVMSKEQILRSANTKQNFVKLIDSKIKSLQKNMALTLNTAIEGSKNDATGALEGFKDLFAGGVYGSLDPVKFPTWKANVNAAPGSFAINGRKLLRKMINDLTIFNERPSIIFMGSNMFDRFDAHIESREFFQSGSDLHVGFVNRTFEQIPVILDKTMDTNTVQFMADDFTWLDVHKQADMELGKPIGFTDKLGVVRHLEWMGALTITDPRRFGQISNWTD